MYTTTKFGVGCMEFRSTSHLSCFTSTCGFIKFINVVVVVVVVVHDDEQVVSALC